MTRAARLTTAAANSGFVFFTLVDPSERTRSQEEIVKSLFPKIGRLNYARSFISQQQTIEVSRSLRGFPVQYVIQAPNFQKLKEILPRFVEEADKHPAFSATDLNLKFSKPELHIIIDRERARSLGVTIWRTSTFQRNAWPKALTSAFIAWAPTI